MCGGDGVLLILRGVVGGRMVMQMNFAPLGPQQKGESQSGY
jgi:hypothetical protein